MARRFRTATSVHAGEQCARGAPARRDAGLSRRVSQRAIPHDRMYVTRGAAKAAVQWVLRRPAPVRARRPVRPHRASLPDGPDLECPPRRSRPRQPPPRRTTRPVRRRPVPGPNPAAAATSPAPAGPAPSAPGLTWPLGWGTHVPPGSSPPSTGATLPPTRSSIRGPVSGPPDPAQRRAAPGVRHRAGPVRRAHRRHRRRHGPAQRRHSRIHTASVWSTPEQLFQLEPGQNTPASGARPSPAAPPRRTAAALGHGHLARRALRRPPPATSPLPYIPLEIA